MVGHDQPCEFASRIARRFVVIALVELDSDGACTPLAFDHWLMVAIAMAFRLAQLLRVDLNV